LDKKYIGKTAGKFKLENSVIDELVTLRSKMYSYKIGDNGAGLRKLPI